MKLPAALLTVALCTAVLAAPAQAAPRVAALTPFSASTITRLGVRPVVIGQTLGGSDQYISSLTGVPVLTLTHPLGPNMEKLATYNPSIVLSSKAWARGTPAMRKLGMKVYESDPNGVAAVGRETRAIGGVLGRTRAANALASKIERAASAFLPALESSSAARDGVARADAGAARRPQAQSATRTNRRRVIRHYPTATAGSSGP